MILFEVFLSGLLLGGMYGLIALGLNLQYGVARILNLSYGEFFLGGAFTAFFTIMLWKLNPLLEPLHQLADRIRDELADLSVPDDPADPARIRIRTRSMPTSCSSPSACCSYSRAWRS